jgi:hypothetical protein
MFNSMLVYAVRSRSLMPCHAVLAHIVLTCVFRAHVMHGYNVHTYNMHSHAVYAHPMQAQQFSIAFRGTPEVLLVP